MTDSILDEFDATPQMSSAAYGRARLDAIRCVAFNTRDGKPCKRGACGIVANRAYCSKHIGAARERDDR